MQAIGYTRKGHISKYDSLAAFETDPPKVGPHDLLVHVHGVSVNPVDVKVRERFEPESTVLIGLRGSG